MSNIGSTALSTAKQHTQTHPEGFLPTTQRQTQFRTGTMDMLDEARQVVENAVGQGQQLNPLIYQMLGLNPTFEDHSGELGDAQKAFDAANQQLNQAKDTLAQLQGIPGGKRSPKQRKQIQQLKRQMPHLTEALGHAKQAFGQLQTSPKTITGFERMDPSQIPAESPFSLLNPLNKAQATEADRLNQYLQGGEVDPTLKHQYDQAEATLRAKLTQRIGPDYENSSVGRAALQNFEREKNNAFATWNQQQVQNYNQMAFQGQANLQNLLLQRIGMYQEPAQNQINEGNALTNSTGARINEEQTQNAWSGAHAGQNITGTTFNPAPMLGSLVGAGTNFLTSPTSTPTGQNGPSYASQLGNWIGNGASSAYNGAAGALSNLFGGGEAAAGDAALGGVEAAF